MSDQKSALPRTGGSRLLFLKPDTYEKLRALADLLEAVPDPNQFEVTERGGKKYFRLRDRQTGGNEGGLGGGMRCPFQVMMSGPPEALKFRVKANGGRIKYQHLPEDVEIAGLDNEVSFGGGSVWLEISLSSTGTVDGVEVQKGDFPGNVETTGEGDEKMQTKLNIEIWKEGDGEDVPGYQLTFASFRLVPGMDASFPIITYALC